MNTASLFRSVADQPPAPSPGQSRREFLTTAVRAAGAVSVPTIVAAKALGLEARAAAASERHTLGVIGFGPRCQYVLGEMLKFPDAQCVARGFERGLLGCGRVSAGQRWVGKDSRECSLGSSHRKIAVSHRST
jgi:hypothetical protein